MIRIPPLISRTFGAIKKKRKIFLENALASGILHSGAECNMPVNGLLLTLSPDLVLAERVCGDIAAQPEVALGERQGIYQPIAVETPDVRSAHEFHEWLESLEGVRSVDVIYVGFEESNTIVP